MCPLLLPPPLQYDTDVVAEEMRAPAAMPAGQTAMVANTPSPPQ